MLVVLDYDDTYTRDPAYWDAFIALTRRHGHSIVCATMRYEHEGAPVIRDLADKVDQIIFTGRKAKHGAVYAAGLNPNIWIDDAPSFIHNDAKA